jgi:hypothetical protein
MTYCIELLLILLIYFSKAKRCIRRINLAFTKPCARAALIRDGEQI